MRKRPGSAAFRAALALSFLTALPAAAEWVDWIAEGDLGFEYDSNLNNAGFSSEEEYDLTWIPELRLGRAYQFAGSTRIQAAIEVRGEIHHRWTDLNAIAGGGRISLFHKFGLGDAPWARVFFAGGYEKIGDDERSGSRMEVGAQTGMRFSPRFDATLGYKFTARDGEDGAMVMGLPGMRTDVWDQQFHEVIADGHFLVTEHLLATIGYEFRHGDLYSNARDKQWIALMQADV
ncbi:unnamed protein product, partial [marine sediment metagenome]